MIEELNRLIFSIYDCNSPDDWDEVTSQISRFVGAQTTQILLGDTHSPLIDSAPDIDPQIGVEYRTSFYQQDLRTTRLKGVRKGCLFREKSLLTEDEYKKSAVHQDLFRRYDITDLHASSFDIDGLSGWIGFSTTRKKNAFVRNDLTRMKYLLLHIEKSFRLAKAKRDRDLKNNALLANLNDTNFAQVTFNDINCDVILNRCAKNLRDQGIIQIVGNRLRFTCRVAQNSFQSMLDRRHSGEITGSVLCQQTHEFLVRIRTRQLQNNDFGAGSISTTIQIFPRRSETLISRSETRDFSKPYNLSPAEDEVIWFVLNLRTLRDYAEVNEIKIDTARKQLKSAMLKMNLRSQKELFRVFETSARLRWS